VRSAIFALIPFIVFFAGWAGLTYYLRRRGPVPRSPDRLRRLQRRGVVSAVIGVVIGLAGVIAGSGQLAAIGFAFAAVQGLLAVLASRGARG
jgi:hypothetical protein